MNVGRFCVHVKLSWKIRIEGSHTGDVDHDSQIGAKYERFEVCFANYWLIGDYTKNALFLNEEIRLLLIKT